MTTISVTGLGPERYGVEIEEGDERTGHLVEMPVDFLENLRLFDADPARVVHESVAFLLDREPGTNIARELSLYELVDRYDDYADELRARLTAPGPQP